MIVHPDNIFRTVEPCVTKLGVVMWRVRRAGVARVRLTDWRIHWLTHRHTQKLTHSPIHNVPLTYWHTHRLTLCHTLRLPHSQTDTLPDILSHSHIYYHIHMLPQSLTATLPDSQTDTLTDSHTVSLTEWHTLTDCHPATLTYSLIDTRTDWTDSLLERHNHSLSHSQTDIFTDRRMSHSQKDTVIDRHIHLLTHCYTHRRTHSLTDILTDWHTYWLTRCQTHRLTHSLTCTVRLTDRHTRWLTHCQTNRLTNLTDILSPLQTDTFIDWQIRWLTHCHTFRLTHLLTFTVLHNDWLTPPLDRHIYWLYFFNEAALVTAGIPHVYHSHFYTHTMAQSLSVILQQFDCFQSNLVRELVS